MASERGGSQSARVPARARPVTQALCRLGRRKPDGAAETRFEQLAERLWELALEKKDRLAIRLILEYCEGKPAATSAGATPAGGRVAITADDLAQATRELSAWEVEDGRAGTEAGGKGHGDSAADQPEAGAPGDHAAAGLHAEAAR